MSDTDFDMQITQIPCRSDQEQRNEKKQPFSNIPDEKSAEQEAQVQTMSSMETTLIMSALCLAVFLCALDSTVVATALPTIAQDLNASESDFAWVGGAYLISCAALSPSWGGISDIFGRKPVLLLANVIFFVGSLVSALSRDIGMLLAGRTVQGVGGGGLLVLVNICIGDLFSMRVRGFYYGISGMMWAVAGAIGPVVGGAFTEYVSWRWCFWINLPFQGLTFIILILYLSIETPQTPLIAGLRAIDWLGSLTVVGGTVMFLVGLQLPAETMPWSSATVICLMAFGVVTVGLFVFVEYKIAKYPLMPLRLFSNRSAAACLSIPFTQGMVFFAISYYLPLYFQTVLGATPLLSGVYLLPFILSQSIVAGLTGMVIRVTGRVREWLWLGMTLMTLGVGLFINFPSHASWSRIICFQLIVGIGIGPNFQGPLVALHSHTEPKDIAAATATFALMRFLASGISLVIGGVVFSVEMTKRITPAIDSLPSSVAEGLQGSSSIATPDLVGGLSGADKQKVLDFYAQSFSAMWIFYTALSALGLCLSLMIKERPLSERHEISKTGLDR